MKKEIYFVVVASVLVVAGWAAWRFTAIETTAQPPTNASLPDQQTTPVTQEAKPAKSHRTTGSPIVSEVIETPEMKKARHSAEISRMKAKSSEQDSRVQAALAAMKAGPRAILEANRARNKPGDMAFLKSLGLSDDIRDKVYEMLGAKRNLYLDHEEKKLEARLKGESYTAYSREFFQKEADIEAVVGTENYDKIKYYDNTLVERHETARFKTYLQSRSLPLTEQQEAAVVDAMVQTRAGDYLKAPFDLGSPRISMEEKLAYIDKLKQSLTPVLNANDMAHLDQHLKEVAESPLKLRANMEAAKKRVEELK